MYYKFEWNEELYQKYGVVYEVFAEFCQNNPEAFPAKFEFDPMIIFDHYDCDDGQYDDDNNPIDRELLYDELYYVQDAWWEE